MPVLLPVLPIIQTSVRAFARMSCQRMAAIDRGIRTTRQPRAPWCMTVSVRTPATIAQMSWADTALAR